MNYAQIFRCPYCIMQGDKHREWCQNKQEQKLMTREEAKRITEQCGMNYPEVFVQCLEALGLLKFDEVVTYQQKVDRLVDACRRFVKSRHTADEASARRCIETYTKELD